METNRFIQLRKIFDEAVLLPASDWAVFLDRACAGDESLRAEAQELLRGHLSAGTTATAGAAEPVSGPRMIGPYRIVRELGAGGMGEVFLAVRDDGIFRKNVAVKLLMRKHATQEFIQRFHQERQVLANLDHPNIARILDGGQTDDGLPYHVMEYVEGLALDQFCDTQRLNLADRIRLFQQVVAAVHYLHESLIVHRDLKPSNILVTAEGQVKLLDFGIAKIQTPLPESPDLTSPANRLLTPTYASPEQVAGAPVSRASDIYSLGVVLYELLTGRLPYTDATDKLSTEPPLPSANIREDLQRTPETTAQLRRRIVGDLDQIVLLCLRRDSRRRYTSAAALGEDLQRFLEGRSVLARREPLVERTMRFLKRNRAAAAVAALILLSLGVGTWKTVQAEIATRQVEAREAAVKRLLDSLSLRRDAKPSSSAARSSAAMTKPAISPAARIDNVRKVRRALEQDLATAWALRPGNTPARRALLEQAAHYLEGMREFALYDAVLAAELASAYKDIGVLYEPCSQSGALAAYRNAALVIEDMSGGNPEHGPAREQWAFIVTRIRNLGGVVPAFATNPRKPRNAPAKQMASDTSPRAPANDVPEQAATPGALGVAPPVVDPVQYAAVKSQLDSALAKGKTADAAMEALQSETAGLGQQVAPDIKANYEHMKRALDSAKWALNHRELASARDNIEIARECARRVLLAAGR